jgi:hypothetical protein
MAGTSSNWTNLGSNTNSTINTDTASEANIDVAQTDAIASGINAQVRRECHMWLVDGDDTETKDFNWSVIGNFTVVLNSALQTSMSDPGDIDVDIVGSVDGENYIKMADLVNWDAGTGTVGIGTYDYNAHGVMPYMRIRLNCENSGADNSAKPIKINVMMH